MALAPLAQATALLSHASLEAICQMKCAYNVYLVHIIQMQLLLFVPSVPLAYTTTRRARQHALDALQATDPWPVARLARRVMLALTLLETPRVCHVLPDPTELQPGPPPALPAPPARSPCTA